MSTLTDGGGKGVPALSAVNAQARAAVQVFRTLEPTLSAYARVLTGNPKARVVLGSAVGGGGTHSTADGTIHYTPPIQLGLPVEHVRELCDKRNERGLQACPACRNRERVLATVYHEIAHFAFESFVYLDDARKGLIAEAVRDAFPGERGQRLAERISAYYGRQPAQLAPIIDKRFFPLLNGMEDARINAAMGEARPGTRAMIEANAVEVMDNGIEQVVDGEKVTFYWRDYPVDLQVSLAVYHSVSGYEIKDDWFVEPVMLALTDPQVQAIIKQARTQANVVGVFDQAAQMFNRLQQLGFYHDPTLEPEPQPEPEEEEEDEQPEPQESDDQTDEQEEDSDDADEDGDPSSAGEVGEDEGDPQQDDESDSTDGGDGSDESDGDSDEGAGDAGEEPDSAEPDADAGSGDEPGDSADDQDQGGQDDAAGQDEDESSDGAGSADDDPEPGESAGGDEAGDAASEGGDDDSSSGEGGEVGDDADAEAASDVSSDPEGGDGPELDAGDLGAGEASGSVGDTLEGEHDADQPGHLGDDDPQAEQEGDGDHAEGESGPDDRPAEDDGEPEPSEEPADSDGEEESDASGDAGSPEPDGDDAGLLTEHESAAPEHTLEERILDSLDAMPTPKVDPDPYEAKALMEKFMGHSDEDDPNDDASVKEAIDQAINQNEYMDEASDNLNKVAPSDQQSEEWWTLEAPIKIPEAHLGKALLHLRRVFADNARGHHERNRRSGRIAPRVLGRRAFHGDDRLFTKKVLPGKRNYAVVLGVDISGSTAQGHRLASELAAVAAQAELLSRVGVDFEIWAHAGSGAMAEEGRMSEYRSRRFDTQLDVYAVKLKHEPWDTERRSRLAGLRPQGYNLDGHTLEFYRKRLDQMQATDKILMYYTDGDMPFANFHEELRILKREIATCKQRGYLLMGVGINTVSPQAHGLDTVMIRSIADIGKVIAHLEKVLT